MKKLKLVLLLAIIYGAIVLAQAQDTNYDAYPPPLAEDISLDEFLRQAERDYLPQITFPLDNIRYYELVDNAYQFDVNELGLLQQNGFVITDRLAYEDFIHAYAWMYWQDLPVLITTDSILHSVHDTFDELLLRTEEMWLSPLLLNLLTDTRDALRAESFTDSTLQQLQADLDLYLSVPIEILSGNYEPNNPSIQTYFTYMRNADTITAIDLFDSPNRQIDFSRFAPSGHYLRSQSLAQYYFAMM